MVLAKSAFASAMVGLIGAMILVGAAWADPTSDQLKAIAGDLDQAFREPANDAATVEKVKKDIANIDRMIEAKQLNDKGILVAYALRGQARFTINALYARQKKPYDLGLARAALADFDRVLKDGVDVNGWFTARNLQYYAGSVAYNQLVSVPLAYDYWNKCADAGHNGCMNIMASAYLSGRGGVTVDLERSFQLNKKVYEGGTSYVCAGAFSAEEIAVVNALTHATRDGDGAAWMARAGALLDQVAQQNKGDEDRCRRSRFDIAEYLIVWQEKGQRSPELLARAEARPKADETDRAVVALLSGRTDEAAFKRVAADAKFDADRCKMHFEALWFYVLDGKRDQAAAHRQALSEVPGEKCASEIAYAKLMRP